MEKRITKTEREIMERVTKNVVTLVCEEIGKPHNSREHEIVLKALKNAFCRGYVAAMVEMGLNYVSNG